MNIKWNKLIVLILAIILVASLFGCEQPESASPASPPPAYAKELSIFAAAGTKPAIDDASRLFEQKYGTKVLVNYGGGGEVLSNMVISKSGDIYIAPEQGFMDKAKKQGAIDTKTIATNLAFMIPVIGVQKGNPKDIKSLADLAKQGIKIAIANPEITALGDIVPEILKRALLYNEVQHNIVTTAPQVTNIITMLVTKNIDAGFIWHYFGTTSSKGIDIIWIPREYVTGIGEVQTAVSTFSKEPKTAQKFIDLLSSSEGKDIFNKFGYIVDREESNKYWQRDY